MQTKAAVATTTRSIDTAPRVLMVYPKFNPNSFWSLKAACEIQGARCPAPPLGLITLAALLPAAWDIRLVDRNADELSDAAIDWADMIMTGGMLPQQVDTLAVIDRCQAAGKPVVVGGPDVMSLPEQYARADFLVLGEAEGLIDRFVAAWAAGNRSGTFTGEKFQADVTASPVPRFDLLTMSHYAFIGIQFSRGCPFNCEFCDIIELYGRVPRTKTNAQVLAELDAIYRTGYRGQVDFVDDNLIGNKKALRLLLPELCRWQQDRRYPFKFSTEASLNLADDPALLEMMSRANFYAVFVGIESTDTDTLIAMQKKQNTRRDIAESVATIYRAGILVSAGFIVGFDSERGRMATPVTEALAATRIPVALIGLLTALPNTQLTRRLEKEGRLLPWREGAGDQCTAGLNFVTKRPRREVLEDYRTIVATAFDIDVFFARVRDSSRLLGPTRGHMRVFYQFRDLTALARLAFRLTFYRRDIGRRYLRALAEGLRHNKHSLDYITLMTIIYMHFGDFSKFLVADLDQRIAELPHDDVPMPLAPTQFEKAFA